MSRHDYEDWIEDEIRRYIKYLKEKKELKNYLQEIFGGLEFEIILDKWRDELNE